MKSKNEVGDFAASIVEMLARGCGREMEGDGGVDNDVDEEEGEDDLSTGYGYGYDGVVDLLSCR